MSHHFKFYVFLSLTLPKFWNRYIFQKVTMEFFLNVFIESGEFSDKKYLSFNGLEPPTSCVRDQDARERHWLQFMLQWFIRFPEFAEITEFNESSAPFSKNSNVNSNLGFQIVDLLIRFLKSKPNDSELPTVFLKCYDILETFLKGNRRKNKMHLAKHYWHFSQQCGSQVWRSM